jgi:deoxycytidylate deaminase
MKIKFFDLARTLSKHSDHPHHKLGAVITRGNKIISLGYNKNKTHTKSNHSWKRLHAEITAIIKAKQDISGCSIYVFRETKQGQPAMARPCSSCMEAIREAGIKRVYYSSNDGYTREDLT